MDTQLHEPKISEMTISEFFGNVVLVFFRRNFNYSEELGTQKIEGGYHKFR